MNAKNEWFRYLFSSNIGMLSRVCSIFEKILIIISRQDRIYQELLEGILVVIYTMGLKKYSYLNLAVFSRDFLDGLDKIQILLYYIYQNLRKTRIYGHLRWPFFSPFGYGRVPELFRMTNIWNGNNSEGMSLIRKEWQ